MLTRDKLHPYQNYSVRRVVQNPKAGLFLDMGLGKTVIILTAVEQLIFEELEVSKALVIGPKRVAETVWSDEVEKWQHLKHIRVQKIKGSTKHRLSALKAPADVYTIGVDNVPWLCAHFGGSYLPFDMVIIDESSRFKNNDSVRFKAIRKILPSVSRVVILTGTPAPNGYLDLWAQLYLLDRGKRLYSQIGRYREAYFVRKYSGWGYYLRPGGEEEIQNKIKDICVSMKSEDYLTLPERIPNEINIYMSDTLREQYREFEKEKVLQLLENDLDEEITALNAAALINKLTQFSGGAVYDTERTVHHIHNLKIEAAKELVENLGGSPLIIAWGFKHSRDRLLKALKSYSPVCLETEQHIRDWNAGKIRVLLTHPASSGHGLNLQHGGNNILWYDHTFSLELLQQLDKRLHRQGQKKPVYVHKLVLRGSVDEKIIAAQESKANEQDALMTAVKAIIKNVKK